MIHLRYLVEDCYCFGQFSSIHALAPTIPDLEVKARPRPRVWGWVCTWDIARSTQETEEEGHVITWMTRVLTNASLRLAGSPEHARSEYKTRQPVPQTVRRKQNLGEPLGTISMPEHVGHGVSTMAPHDMVSLTHGPFAVSKETGRRERKSTRPL